MPDFTVAGVTDWTAVGGHGSDATLRSSESLAQETLKLQASPGSAKMVGGDQNEAHLRASLTALPRSAVANRDLGEFYLFRQQYALALPPLQTAYEIDGEKPTDEYDLALTCWGLGDFAEARQHVTHALKAHDLADLERLAGMLDEKLGKPLAAVEELRRATELDGSEENYLQWGSELLLHRAVWQATEVFQDGVKAHPTSSKLKTAWASALFSGALYEQAAQQICEASDLAPSSVEIYQVIGKIELAAPARLPCIEQRLARFIKMKPRNAEANFLYAMTLSKIDPALNRQQVEELLKTAIGLDVHNSGAYLELGKLSFNQRDYAQAIRFYQKAVDSDPRQGEAHYRLAVAYDRVGESDLANRERRLHDEVERKNAEEIEQGRRLIKQFVVVTQTPPAPSPKL